MNLSRSSRGQVCIGSRHSPSRPRRLWRLRPEGWTSRMFRTSCAMGVRLILGAAGGSARKQRAGVRYACSSASTSNLTSIRATSSFPRWPMRRTFQVSMAAVSINSWTAGTARPSSPWEFRRAALLSGRMDWSAICRTRSLLRLCSCPTWTSFFPHSAASSRMRASRGGRDRAAARHSRRNASGSRSIFTIGATAFVFRMIQQRRRPSAAPMMNSASKSSTPRTSIKRLRARGDGLCRPFINAERWPGEYPHRRASSLWEMPSRSSNSRTATGLSHTRCAEGPVFIFTMGPSALVFGMIRNSGGPVENSAPAGRPGRSGTTPDAPPEGCQRHVHAASAAVASSCAARRVSRQPHSGCSLEEGSSRRRLLQASVGPPVPNRRRTRGRA